MNLVQQVLVVDSEHLVLQEGPIGALLLLFNLHVVVFVVWLLSIVLLSRLPVPLARRFLWRLECRGVKLLLDALPLRVVSLQATLADKSISL